MDVNTWIGGLQLAVAAYQLRLDHFTKRGNRQDQSEVDSFDDLGEAIRALEYALAETVAFVGQNAQREPNPKIASLWEEASKSARKIRQGADLADLTFEKNLYWLNPERFQGQKNLYRISFDNVLLQLRSLRGKYEKLQNKLRN